MYRNTGTSPTAGFDLQLFADDPKPTDASFWGDAPEQNAAAESPEAEHPAVSEPAEEPADEQAAEPERSQAPEPNPQQQPAVTKTEEGFEFAGRVYPSKAEAARAYKSLQGEMTRMRQGLPPRDPDALAQLLGTQAAPAGPQAQQPGYPQQGHPQQPSANQQQAMPPQQVTPQMQQAVAQEVAKGRDPKAVWADMAKDPEGFQRRIAREEAQQLWQQSATPVLQQIHQMRVNNTLNALRADTENYPGFREMEGDIAAYLQKNPALAQVPGGLEHAYNAVVGINSRAGLQQVQAAQQQVRQQVAEGKTRATTEGQRARQAPPPPKDPDEAEADAIVNVARRRRYSVV